MKKASSQSCISANKDKVSFTLFNASGIAPIKDVLKTMENGGRKTVDICEGQAADYKQLSAWLMTTSNS